VELMARRPRKPDDQLNSSLYQDVTTRLDQLLAAASQAESVDAIKDYEADGENLGLFAAYFCPANEVCNEGMLELDTLEGWGIPKTAPDRIRNQLSPQLKSPDAHIARGALYSVYAELDSWSDYNEEYNDTMNKYCWWLSLISGAALGFAVVSLCLAIWWWCLVICAVIFGGASGGCIGVLTKRPTLADSLSGQLDEYGRQVFARVGVGIVTSICGCGFLAWGVLPISIQGHDFAGALKDCVIHPASLGETVIKALIVLAVSVLLGFSERALPSFEKSVLGDTHTPLQTKKGKRKQG
jgi:hypothetical protein